MKRFIAIILFLPVTAFSGAISTSRGSGTVARSLGTGSVAVAVVTPTPTTPSCSGNFALDTFTESGTGNINLDSHTPEVGGTWQGAAASDGSIAVDRGNDDVRCLVSGLTKSVYLSVTPECADYSVTVIGRPGSTSSTNRIGPLARWDGSNGYRFLIYGDGTYTLDVFVAGVDTQLATGSISGFVASANATIVLDVNGTTINGVFNGTTLASVTNSAVSSVGAPGFTIRNPNARGTSLTADY